CRVYECVYIRKGSFCPPARGGGGVSPLTPSRGERGLLAPCSLIEAHTDEPHSPDEATALHSNYASASPGVALLCLAVTLAVTLVCVVYSYWMASSSRCSSSRCSSSRCSSSRCSSSRCSSRCSSCIQMTHTELRDCLVLPCKRKLQYITSSIDKDQVLRETFDKLQTLRQKNVSLSVPLSS
ncbi:hypothetical protein FHG87_015712, partial [Trinorchestia longiramus]